MKGFFVVIGSIALVVLIIFGSWAFRYYTADIRGQVEMQEEVMSGEFRMMSYNHFYNLYAEIQAYENQIENQKDLMEGTEGDELKRYKRNLLGLKNQRASAVQKYNADVRKEGTRGQFVANDLPKKISIEM